MRRLRLSHRGYTPAFTIVELLIVIVIIAILATITIVAYNGVTANAKKSSAMSDLRSTAASLEVYKITNGHYPADMSVLNLKSGILTTVSYRTNTSRNNFCIDRALDSAHPQLSWVATGVDQSVREGSCRLSSGPGLEHCSDFAVNDISPAGGWIFYIDDSTSPRTCYEVSPAGWNGGSDPVSQWGCIGKNVSGTTSGVGSGALNTQKILNFHNNPANFGGNDYYSYSGNYADIGCISGGWISNGQVAAKYTEGLIINGYDGWFITSSDESIKLWQWYVDQGKPSSAGFSSSNYSTSSELGSGHARLRSFSDGGDVNFSKIDGGRVRPIRSFSN